MRIKTNVFLLSIFLYFSCSAQEKFVLKVSTDNSKVKTLDLQQAMAPSFYPSDLKYESEIDGTNGIFLFNGSIEEPYYCDLLIDSTHFSKPFVLYPGKNALKIIKVEGEIEIIREDDYLNDNLYTFYNSWFSQDRYVHQFLNDNERLIESKELRGSKSLTTVDIIQDSLLKSSYRGTDTALYLYSRDYPDSYNALWKIANLMMFGYEILHGDSFEKLNDDLKNSYLGNHLDSLIEKYEKVAVGKTIPNAHFENEKGERVFLYDFFDNQDLILIDFWYHNCGPCLAQFPKVKELYTANKDKGFQVVGISTDKAEDSEKWIQKISEEGLDWVNLIDSEGVSSDEYGVTLFPFNYLVNNKGKILKVNISNVELFKVLKNNNDS